MHKFKKIIGLHAEMLEALESVQNGTVILQAGEHAISIETDGQPKQLWFSVKSGNMPVCYGHIDKIGYSLIENGFILYATVVSDTLHVDWYVEFDNSCD